MENNQLGTIARLIFKCLMAPGLFALAVYHKVRPVNQSPDSNELGNSDDSVDTLEENGIHVGVVIVSVIFWFGLLFLFLSNGGFSSRSQVNACVSGTYRCQTYEADVRVEDNSNAVVAKENVVFVDRLYPPDGASPIELTCQIGAYCYETANPNVHWSIELLVK